MYNSTHGQKFQTELKCYASESENDEKVSRSAQLMN